MPTPSPCWCFELRQKQGCIFCSLRLTCCVIMRSCRAHEGFIKAVQASMGGQVPAAELHEAASAVWAAFKNAPKSEEAKKRRASLANLHKPFRCGMHACFAPEILPAVCS